ncbi:lysosomal-trafficking regulator isoform X5 [Helicoverpa zea]|uniref:lysosomal-trafficking regulator isoform X5 n=1 Tax=Helicoverpa zea TaxID=7113 RepID=UPI001F57D0AA|nr:lysosomal-trafficking regulator isoform X5 [Helicoverpa zea]
MATEEDIDTLKLYWDHFFKAETGTYEKSTWLDLFLAEFLIRVNDGANPKELIKFCPVSGVVTLVGCELLCGIHRVTSSINTHYSVPLPDAALPHLDARDQPPYTEQKPEEQKVGPTSLFTRINTQSSEQILKKYLLGGVAWRCLVLLKALGVEGLSCCRQLSSVLIWLFGELSGAASDTSVNTKPSPPTPRTPIHQLFSNRIWSKQKPIGGQTSKVHSAASSERGSVTGRSRHSTLPKLDSLERTKKRLSKHTDQSSESADSNDDLQILNRSLTIKVCTPNDDFEYFNSTKSSNEYPNDSYYDPFYTPRKAKPKADDYMNDKHREIINSEITTFQFTLIITDLLQELCKAESSLSGSEGSQISMQCINFSLRNLCSLQFTSLPQSQQDNTQEVSRIKVALTELLMVSLDQVLIHSDLCAKLINNGILPMLLRILEDVISKCRQNKLEYQNRKEDKTESENLLKFVFGIAYSITAFFHCLLMQCRSVDKLREFTDQFKLYGECQKGGLLKDCMELMIRIPAEEEEVVVLIKKLIETVGKLIVGMKRVRAEVVHGAACTRARHKACRARVARGLHHHHAALGAARAALPPQPACCVALLYATLSALLADDELAAHALLRHKVLKVMLSCGVCCCLEPALLMETVVRLMLTHGSVASLCLRVLEHTVYGELGASILIPKVTDQLPCSICEPSEDKREVNKKLCSHGISPIERKSVWSFLYHYNSLLQLDNHSNVLHATVSHLLRVTPKCRMEMKYELLFSVIYPTFIVAKHRYIIRMEESAYFLTVSCLNIFASLLNTVSFAEQFIQKGGLSYVLELVSLSEFSNQCCSILEIAIIVEVFKLMKENSDMTYYREMSTLASVQMLFKSLAEMTDKCYKIYRLKLPGEKFAELCDVSKERDMLAFIHPAELRATQHSAPQSINTTYACSENVVEQTIEDHIEIVKNVCTFWRSCANLCLYSPMFRQYVTGEAAFLDSYALLKLLLHYLCHCDCSPQEMRILIKITEALLTVQLSASDVTSGRSKETSCALVRAALCAGGAAEGGAGLRALCEALIRVAAARPSRVHVMPRIAHAKVPPLLCASGSSSAECSSSEDSVAGPYASEHSEPYSSRPDEGYEADVEVGKLDVPPLYRTRKLSGSMSTISSGMSLPTGELSAECGEYSKSGELAHPELCVIVVDILTQLIDKLVGSKEQGGTNGSSWRLGVGVARAWCGRVGAALARARPMHSPLLARLLAPAPARLLAVKDERLEDLQRSILELIHVLGSQSIEPAELAAFLKLFTAENPPLSMLLGALHRLVSTATYNTPDCILTFPVDTDNTDGIQSLAEELSYLVVNTTTSQSHHAENLAKKFHESHLRAGIKSCWSCHAVRVGVEGAGWAPWLAGFALVLWLHRQHATPDADHWDGTDEFNDESSDTEAKQKKSPKKEASSKPTELSHIVSVGHESLMLDTWLDTNTGTFTFRLTRPEVGLNRIVSEARVTTDMPARQWTCVALNVKELVYKRHIYVQVTLYVNGYECEVVTLPVQGILVRKVTPTVVLLGHACPGGTGAGAYHLAGASLYRSAVLTQYTALHLTAHGPDHACQVRCESPNYPLILTPNVLDSNIDWDQVFEISTTTLRELHDNLLLTFSASAPNIMNLYHQTVALPTVFAGRVASSAGLMSASASGAASGGAGSSIPETLFTTWTAAPVASRHRGLTPAIYMLGGPDVLLYLYARVVELEGSAAEQATALGILLRACRVDNRLHSMLYSDAAPDMLLTVLAAPACRVSHHLLKVILDEACSSPLLTICGDSVQLAARTDAVLLQPELLVLLANAWRHLDTEEELTWETEQNGGRVTVRGSAWALALCCVRALLRDEHPRRAFNHTQMCRRALLDHLLRACKERFLNSECGPLDAVGSAALVDVVRGLVGAPPLLCRLAALADFLLLMHQASDTFVTHSRANFYFLLTSETQEMSEFASSSTKRRPSKRVRKRDENRPSVSSTSTDDVSNDNSLSSLKDKAQSRELDDRIDSSCGSTESTKQLKSKINSQIKEGRKHTVSSTSENSDTPAESSGTTEREGSAADEGTQPENKEPAPEALTDYIVVDADDVNHTTVEMYTSGIYHQRRVRAGAASGWSACEGLLLLLRHALALLPDHEHQQAACGAVCASTLVVLCNQRGARARAAAVRALAALTRRAAPDAARRLLQQHYYIHLANQISLYEGSWELASACAALLTKCDVPLEDQLDDDIWTDVSEEALQRSPALLALLPCCLADVPLAHNITLLARRIIDKASLKVLNEIALVEVVVRSIRAVGEMPDTTFEGRDLLLEDLFELLNRVAIKALSSQHSMQTISELHHLLTYAEWSGGAGAAAAARAAQRALFLAQLDHLEERLHASYATTNRHNYFTTVLSSAVSLGGEGAARAERGELAARLLATVSRAVSFLLAHSPREPLDDDAQLFDRLLSTMLLAVSGSNASRPKWWVSSSADWATPLQELFWWAASPAPGAWALQAALLRALYHAPAPVLHVLTPSDPAHLRKLAVYLLTILKHIHAEAESGTAPVELAITDWARAWAVGTQAGLSERVPSAALAPEAAALLRQDEERWARLAHRTRSVIAKVVWSKESLASKVSDSAMAVTRGVVDAQNAQRKAFMEHLRRAHAAQAAASQAWQRLIDTYTHEQAVWHMPRSYPQSWQLDATEGPGRVRVRLRRAHLHVPDKFLKPQHRHKAEARNMAGPLRSVVGSWGALRGGLVARLQLHETVAYMARATRLTAAAELDGELLLSDRSVHFVPDPAPAAPPRRTHSLVVPEVQAAPQASRWPLAHIMQVSTRRWCLQERAVELFLSSGQAHLLAFADTAERAAFLKALAATQHPPARIEPDTLQDAMTQWRNGSITNWEYLMRLNGLGGRSYNDLMQYPVLPFVLADYSSRILDLNDPASFRDLAKPMAVQNKTREQHYINIYNDLKAARREGCSPLLSRQPHHYASLYSNSGGVLHYLVRVPPFTELFLNYQDNNFDMPDRTFHSLATTWRLITNDSPTDVKELIPELFYLPELFHNNEGLNLGTRQCGAAVDDVELPPWAGDARLFTLIHRQALEAAYVTEHLPHWIDLVFGYKQTGQPALDAINVFPACTYYGFDPTALEEEVDRTAAAAMVRTYGQAPRQLLRAPHPHAAPDLHHASDQVSTCGQAPRQLLRAPHPHAAPDLHHASDQVSTCGQAPRQLLRAPHPHAAPDLHHASDQVSTCGQAPRQLLRAPHPHAAPDLHHASDQVSTCGQAPRQLLRAPHPHAAPDLHHASDQVSTCGQAPRQLLRAPHPHAAPDLHHASDQVSTCGQAPRQLLRAPHPHAAPDLHHASDQVSTCGQAPRQLLRAPHPHAAPDLHHASDQVSTCGQAPRQLLRAPHPHAAPDLHHASDQVSTCGQAPRQLLRAPHPHAAPDLHHASDQVPVWAGVVGARWGRWCGSPELQPPTVVWRRTCAGAASLYALPHARSVAVASRATALIALHDEAANNAQNNGQQPLALVSWGHSDNIVRLKRRRDVRPDLLFHVCALDQITKVVSICATGGCPYPLVVGYASGRVSCVRVRSTAAGARAAARGLHAHAAAAAGLHACARAGLLVSASVDGHIVLWDLHTLSYIRTLPNRDMLSVTHVTISETLCDIASVHDMTSSNANSDGNGDVTPDANDVSDNHTEAYEKDAAYKYKSLIRVHTVNARFVGSVKVCERVTCICYSNAPEGISVNAIAAGLATGAVRLYSSWDLRALRLIPAPDTRAPLLSITFSSDSQLLFGCYAGGVVVAWESAGATRPAPVRIVPAHALF